MRGSEHSRSALKRNTRLSIRLRVISRPDSTQLVTSDRRNSGRGEGGAASMSGGNWYASRARTIADLRKDLTNLRKLVIQGRGTTWIDDCGRRNTSVFSNWMNQEMTPKERYLGVKAELQDLAHRLLIFGTHVHVGIEDPGVSHRLPECGALRVAAHSVHCQHEFAVLVWSQYRIAFVSQYCVQEFPAYGCAAHSARVGATTPISWTRWSRTKSIP